jgi:hypothetical protein
MTSSLSTSESTTSPSTAIVSYSAPMIFSRLARSAFPSRIPPFFYYTGAFTTAIMSSSQYTTSPQNPFPTRKYQSHHQQWPYDSKLDFSRYDEADDNSFYTQPRFVAHIDDAALARLTTYYSNVVPSSGTVLDLCTSWRSWYSPSHQEAVADGSLKVHGIGLNAAELAANPLFSDFPERWKVLDLNREELDANEEFDCVTCTVSVDYLVKAVDVLSSVRKCTKEGGKVHLAVSNRCFPSKAVRIWLGMSTEERLGLVGGE